MNMATEKVDKLVMFTDVSIFSRICVYRRKLNDIQILVTLRETVLVVEVK